jgi:N-formylglutamate deformylase
MPQRAWSHKRARLGPAVGGYAGEMGGTPLRPDDDRRPEVRGPFAFPDDAAALPMVATAIHAGHDLRPEVRRRIAVDESTRRREEDPFTDRIIERAGPRVIVNRSRFEVDLNRARPEAVYRPGDETWGVDVWREPLPDGLVRRSLAIYDAFYDHLAAYLDRLAENGPFVVLDVHSYNHRRRGPRAPAAPADGNPDVNVGTGPIDRERWAPVVDALIAALASTEVHGAPIDVRENVRFRGAHLARWVHDRYPQTGCPMALEFKKTFMDEWTGAVDEEHLRDLTAAVSDSVPAVVDAVDNGRR